MFHTKLCDLLGIRYPIIQGALGGIAGGARLAAAVSNAGGLGVLASFNLTTKQLHDEINEIRTLTNKPFGLNIFAINAAFIKRVVGVIVDEGISIVTTGRGDPREPMVTLLKEHSITVLPVVPTVRHAIRMEVEGADAVIASGMEAGGHVGTVCSLPLIPQVVSAVKIPVVAAGGIGDARGFVAALALGASGIQMGTRFLATHESGINIQQKQRILSASEEDTIPTAIFTGRDVRVIKSADLDELSQKQKKGATPEELGVLTNRIKERRRGSPEINMTAGQISGMISQIEYAGDVISKMIKEATDICNNMNILANSQ